MELDGDKAIRVLNLFVDLFQNSQLILKITQQRERGRERERGRDAPVTSFREQGSI